MVGNMYDPAAIARGGYGPMGTGHPPPPGDQRGPERAAPTFEILGKAAMNGHAAADRIESALDRIEPTPPPMATDGIEPGPPSGHAANLTVMLQLLASRLHRLADRLETHA